ncbi:MAG TPA: 1-deoxy-D-xylulose-5-phosphate reductoisomerase [Terriglobia bacterium]|nr:1-deoxy-D-xylulose-5-phosphate reductoisomerase [Terriglobia bacterium]
MKRICILGSTGSIGTNTLRVVRSLPGRFRVESLSAGRNLDLLAEQIIEFRPRLVSVGASEWIEPLRQRVNAEWAMWAKGARGDREPLRIVAGSAGRVEAATLPEVDFVVSASHGTTGLVATYEAVRAGKSVGLANKEVLVVAGQLVTGAARELGVDLLPIDSEHSALHQCLRAGSPAEVRRVILTASGGPFLRTPPERFDSITPEQALKHPVWKMGGRVTIDSATLMNKGLEIIEAHWLFGVPSGRISVLIHPESIVHSMIEFSDGSVMGQLSVADMRIPIQYALTYPERVGTNGDCPRLDLVRAGRLSFEEPDTSRFACLALGRAALEQGGAMPCALNAADEVAVEAFLGGRLRFGDIPRVIEKVMGDMPSADLGSMAEVLECDQEGRRRAAEVIGSI